MAVSSSNVSAANSNGCSVVSESLSSNSVLQNGNLTWTVQALCSSPYNLMNTEQGIGYLCGGGVCVNVNGRSVINSRTYAFAFTVPLNFPVGSATLKMTARASNYTTVQEINSNFSIMVDAMTVPTTTTTIATTTTTTISRPSFNVCWSGWVNSYGQNDAWVLREVYYSTSLNAYQYPNLSRPNVPVPSGGCSSLNPVAPTTTTVAPTTVAPTTTTTTIYNPRITYCQATMTHYVNSVPQWNYANWQQGNETLSSYTSHALLYPNSFRYPVPAGGCSSLNTVQTTTTTSPPVVQQKVQVAPIPVITYPVIQSPVITSPVIQSPVITTPVIQSPVITLPKTISTEQENKNYESSCASQTWSVNGDCVIVSPWKYVWMNKTHTTQMRTGALCYSGKRSTATSSGACSHNGGVKNWIYYSTKSTSKVKYRCWLNKNTNTYNKNCIAV